MLRSGQDWQGGFATVDGAGVLVAPTVGPTAVLYVDGVLNAAGVTVGGANPYAFEVTLPVLADGQTVQIWAQATIAGLVITRWVAADTVNETAQPGDAMALTGAERTATAGVVDTTLSGTHGAGSWENTAGAGSVTWQVTIVDNLATPIAGADVWVTTTTNPSINIVASGVSGALGVVTFYLDPGTYYIWAQKTGINFTNPTQIVVV